MNFDTSTINLDLLNKLPLAKLPPSYRLQDGCGNGCYGDPPGYPTYFTRCVYTSHGNSPSRKGQATLMLLGHIVARNYDTREATDAKLHSLWLPLTLGHPRTVAWIRHNYRHFANCYSIPTVLEYGRPKTLIQSIDYAHREFKDDPRFSDEWRVKEQAAIEAYNREQDVAWAKIAVPENHCAVRYIRKFYPGYMPDVALIENPPEGNEGNWWETYATCPKPEECPGSTERWGRMSKHKHPMNGTWCQVCGWHASEAV